MDRNSLIGLVLIGGILIGWLILNGPNKEELLKQKHRNDSIAKVELAQKAQAEAAAIAAKNKADSAVVKGDTITRTFVNADSIRKASIQNKFRDFSDAASGENKTIVLENQKIKVSLQTKGASVASVILKEYTLPDKQTKVELFGADSTRQAMVFYAYENNLQINSDSLYFTAGEVKKAGDVQSVAFRLSAKDPKSYIEFVYTLKENDYMLGFTLNMVGMQSIISPRSPDVDLIWKMLTPSQEAHVEKEKQASTVYWKFIGEDESADNINPGKDERKAISEAPVQWVALKQQFFTAAIIYDKGQETGFTRSEVNSATAHSSLSHVKNMEADLTLAYKHGEKETTDMRFYFGPNQYNTLKSYDIGLEKMINIGWPVFNLINKWLVIPVFNAFNNSTVNFGIIILILTIIIKTLLFPIAWKTYMSSSKMRVLKPELDVINKKYPDSGDAMKKNQESMALYRRAGASPFSGCIPALIQFPILIALLNFFPASIELRQKAFLWADDLSTYDSIWTYGNVPVINSIYGDHVSLFALLMFASTIVYTWMNAKFYTPANQQQMPGMKFMMYFMPFIFLSFMNSYSSGLSWYYFLANVITFAQTWAMRKFVSDDKIRAQIDANMKKPVKKSKFAQRLEDIAKQRQAPVRKK